MDRGVWWATVHGVAKSWTGLSDSACVCVCLCVCVCVCVCVEGSEKKWIKMVRRYRVRYLNKGYPEIPCAILAVFL